MTNLSEEQKKTEMAENKRLLTPNEMLRMGFARVLHKALRQFEVEGCPEAFKMKVHIDQLVRKVLETGYLSPNDVAKTASIKDKECEEKLAKCRAETLREVYQSAIATCAYHEVRGIDIPKTAMLFYHLKQGNLPDKE